MFLIIAALMIIAGIWLGQEPRIVGDQAGIVLVLGLGICGVWALSLCMSGPLPPSPVVVDTYNLIAVDSNQNYYQYNSDNPVSFTVVTQGDLKHRDLHYPIEVHHDPSRTTGVLYETSRPEAVLQTWPLPPVWTVVRFDLWEP